MTCSTYSLNALRYFSFVLSLLAFTGSRAQTDILPTSVDLRLMQGADTDQLMVQIKTHSTADFGGILSALTITIRYDATSGATLGNGTSFCNAWSPFPPSPTVVNAGMAYRTYNGFGANRLEDPLGNGGCATSLVPEQWFTVTTIAVSGTGCTAFTLGNDDWTAANNRDFYLSMAGQNVTGAVLGGAVDGGNCALDCQGMAGGPSQPGTACDDGNANTSNDQWSSSCVCIGTVGCTAPAITGITSNAPICAGSTLSLGGNVTGTAPLSYSWSGTGNFSPNAYSANVNVSGAASGNYQVTVANGCGNASASVDITLNDPPNASIAYSGSPYCTGSATASVTRTGSAGGTYSATPAGLSINPSNGSITLGTSSVGTYTVTYGILANGGCPAFSTTAAVTVNNPPNASIAYAGSPYCNGSGIASVTRIGTPGGTYSATPAGLSINPSNGSITLGSSSDGTYTVTYSLLAGSGCSALNTTAMVTVNNAPDAGIVYTGSPYCTGSGTAGVARTGSAGGTYSAIPAGLSINASNGSIILSTSSADTYTVTYSIAANGGCSAFSTTAMVTVSSAPNASIVYTGSPYCNSSGTAGVARTGSAGGTYSATPSGLSINPSNGAISLGASIANTYTVNYSIAANGGCSAFSTTAAVTVKDAPEAIIVYTGSPYCTGSGTTGVARTGSAGGTYSATPAGLSINPANGSIYLGASIAGTYTVAYSIGASDGCSAFSTTATVTVDEAPNASIAYEGSPYCTGGGMQEVALIGTAGGIYTASPLGIALDPILGNIDLGSSAAGAYTVTYSLSADGGCSAFSTSATVEVGNASNALITFPGSPYCNGGGTATVVRWGSSGGTYSAVPSGLAINANNGTLSLGTSIAGSYTVTYSIAAGDGCPSFNTTTTVVISDEPDAVIVYTGSPFCGVTAAGVTRTGTSGGTYTAAPAGLVINANTGTINLVNSMPGNYTVTYAIAGGGGCSAFSTSAAVALNEETTWYFDTDGDGVGVLVGSVVACIQPAGYVPISGDGCPNDPDKIAPGTCGCGIPDIDTDSDGAPDCIDGCPTDPGKVAPGACGCGIPDTDTDSDGAPDCVDGCPNDPGKTAPGICGCGIPDTDTDQDGLPDCMDNCPGLTGAIGDTCDDGDSTTVMDIITADCVCQGTITTGIHGAAEELGMFLWPNPTSDRAFTIRMLHANVGGTVDLFVRDASGRQIYALTGDVMFTREIAVQLPQGTASGLYIVEVRAGDEMTRMPLMCR